MLESLWMLRDRLSGTLERLLGVAGALVGVPEAVLALEKRVRLLEEVEYLRHLCETAVFPPWANEGAKRAAYDAVVAENNHRRERINRLRQQIMLQ